MSGFVDDPTDEDYAAAARAALKDKDFRLALQQAAAAVAMRPAHAPHVDLLDEVIARAKAPLELLKLADGKVFFGTVAARARALARLGRVDEAMARLFDAAAFRPSAPFIPWGVAWVEKPKDAKRVDPMRLAASIVKLADAARAQARDDGAATNLQAALAIAAQVQARHAPSVELLAARSRALRALGKLEEARALLDAGDDEASWAFCVERAAVEREAGDHQARVRWLERALAVSPDDAATQLDLGDAQLDDGDLDAAATWYERALARDDTGWARVSLAYVRALASGAPDGVPTDDSEDAVGVRARMLAADLAAYVTRLPDPVDPVAGVIRGVMARARSAPEDRSRLRVRIHADRAIAPSARGAFTLASKALGREGEMIVDAADDDSRFGPSLQRAEVPPADAVMQAVRALVTTPFDAAAWRARATDLAASLSAEDRARTIDAMMHPPAMPAEADPVQWVHGAQLAVALLVACSPDSPELRRTRLSPWLEAVDDWSSAAAIVAMHALAQGEPTFARDLLERARAFIPPDDAPLPPSARALAVVGCDLARGDDRRPFLRLRARVRREGAPR